MRGQGGDGDEGAQGGRNWGCRKGIWWCWGEGGCTGSRGFLWLSWGCSSPAVPPPDWSLFPAAPKQPQRDPAPLQPPAAFRHHSKGRLGPSGRGQQHSHP